MKQFGKYKVLNKILKSTGALWCHQKEIEWLQNTYLMIDSSDLKKGWENIHLNILRAGILGAIYTEFCFRFIEEQGVCQSEGLVNGLKICLDDLNYLNEKQVEYLTQSDIIEREHQYVASRLKQVYQFKKSDTLDWDMLLVDDLLETIDYNIEESSGVSDWVVEMKFGDIYTWISEGFMIN